MIEASVKEKALPAPPRPLRLRRLLLPTEHGSWGLVVEPVALGLAVAPSWPGLGMATAALAVFLMRRPFQARRTDRKRGHRDRRTAVAAGFLALCGLIALLGLAGALRAAGSPLLLPLGLAAPLAVIFAVHDARQEGRSLAAELAGPTAFAAVPAAVALAGGWPLAPALALAGVVVARSAPTVLYVRERLRLDRGRPRTATALIAHAIALGGVLLLIGGSLLPASAAVGFVVLLARAAFGLSAARRPTTPQELGYLELGYGLLTLVAVAAGFWW